jgi:hypothetical protein
MARQDMTQQLAERLVHEQYGQLQTATLASWETYEARMIQKQAREMRREQRQLRRSGLEYIGNYDEVDEGGLLWDGEIAEH